MEQITFRMQLNPGQAAAYKRRRDGIWPGLVAVLKAAGVADYNIFLDPETNALFAVLRRNEGHRMDGLPEQEVVRRWWCAMADIMQTNPDGSPTATPLQPMFHLA